MLIAWKVACDIVDAQQDQERNGHRHEGMRKYVRLPTHGWTMRIWLFVFLPRWLYNRIEWTAKGAVFLARKSDELV